MRACVYVRAWVCVYSFFVLLPTRWTVGELVGSLTGTIAGTHKTDLSLHGGSLFGVYYVWVYINEWILLLTCIYCHEINWMYSCACSSQPQVFNVIVHIHTRIHMHSIYSHTLTLALTSPTTLLTKIESPQRASMVLDSPCMSMNVRLILWVYTKVYKMRWVRCVCV